MQDTLGITDTYAELKKSHHGAEIGLFCQICFKKYKCKQICKKLEKILPKRTTGRNKKEIIVSGRYLEYLASQKVFSMLYGKKYMLRKPQENEDYL